MQWRELKRAGISLGSLLVAYLIYTLLIVPIIEPPAPRPAAGAATVGTPMPSATDRYQTDLAGLFPADAWENASPKILRNRAMLLLFQDYQPQQDGTLRVFPCTVVVLGDRSSDASRRATSLILQAPDGAVLQLNRPVNIQDTQLGEPVAGFLRGKIRIHRQGEADGSGRLEVLTSEVQIKPQTILTPHEVEFQFEQNHAVGKDLMIRLMPLRSNRKLDTGRGWAGVRSIELVHLRQLHLEVKDERPPRDDASPATTPVDVTCRGPLRVDFARNLLTLEEHVELRRLSAEGLVDTLTCHKLVLYLQSRQSPQQLTPSQSTSAADAPPTAPETALTGSPPRTTTRGDRMASLPKLEVVKVLAEGEPVVLNAPSRRASMRGRRLLYDLKLGRFQLWAAPDDPADEVLFRHDQQQITARQLDCTLASPRRVQEVRAAGPGRFVGQLTGTTPQPVEAEWQTSLLFEQQGELHRLTLDRDARVRVGESYGIEAEVLQLWLEAAEPRPDARPSDERQSPIDLALRPQRLVAVAHPQNPSSRPVRLRSSGVTATTQRLEAQFRHLAQAGAPAAEQAGRSRVRMTSSSPTASLVPPRDSERAPLPARETRVFGRDLQVVLRVQGGQVTVDDLLLTDEVRIQQYARQDPARPLFDLRADSVQMQDPAARQLHTLVATGQPVVVDSDQLRLQTLQLHMDQADNRIWTERPGRMRVLADRDVNGQPLPSPQEIVVDWFRSMDFDGLRAHFVGGVDVRGTDQRMRSEELNVELTRRVDLSNSSAAGPVEIRKLLASGNVLIENRELNEQRLMSISYLQVPHAQIDRPTGELRAGGPGRLITLREGFRSNLNLASASAPGSPAASASASASAAQATAAETTEAKTFLQVDYQREISGNLYRKIVEFADRVKVIYGPVLSWNESLSADSPLRANDVLLSCDRLTVAQTALVTGGPPMMDLIAQGNTYVEGQTFTARGERVSYQQSKELLVLEGTGRSNAVLSHQPRVGAPRSDTTARKILYWIRTGRAELDDAQYLDLSNLGS